MKAKAAMDAESVKKRSEERLLSIPGVVGVGVGSMGSRPVIKVYVSKKSRQIAEAIPKEVEGVPVEVIEAGDVRAL